MVVDSDRRSHGWDGSESDNGVELWARRDRKTLDRVACWRYRAFAEEWDRPGGAAGSADLSSACTEGQCNP